MFNFVCTYIIITYRYKVENKKQLNMYIIFIYYYHQFILEISFLLIVKLTLKKIYIY